MPWAMLDYKGIRLWVEYKAHDYDDIEVIEVQINNEDYDIAGILSDAVLEAAFNAAELDYMESHVEEMDRLRRDWQNPVYSD